MSDEIACYGNCGKSRPKREGNAWGSSELTLWLCAECGAKPGALRDPRDAEIARLTARIEAVEKERDEAKLEAAHEHELVTYCALDAHGVALQEAAERSLRLDYPGAHAAIVALRSRATQAEAEAARMATRIEELEAGLRPFAAVRVGTIRDDIAVMTFTPALRAGDFRRARALLSANAKETPRDSWDSLLVEYHAWVAATIAHDPPAALLKLKNEIAEFIENPSPDEAADVALCLFNYARKHDIDLLGAARAKHEKNKARSWRKGADGTWQHVPSRAGGSES